MVRFPAIIAILDVTMTATKVAINLSFAQRARLASMKQATSRHDALIAP
jgi:hypothetical protein